MPALHGVGIGARIAAACRAARTSPRGHRPQAADAFGDFGAAGADQPADAEDFALAQFEADIA